MKDNNDGIQSHIKNETPRDRGLVREARADMDEDPAIGVTAAFRGQMSEIRLEDPRLKDNPDAVLFLRSIKTVNYENYEHIRQYKENRSMPIDKLIEKYTVPHRGEPQNILLTDEQYYEKTDILRDLSAYKKQREQEGSEFNNDFLKIKSGVNFLKHKLTGTDDYRSRVVKIAALEKLVKSVQENMPGHFSSSEIKALKSGRLGDIVKRHPTLQLLYESSNEVSQRVPRI